MAKSKKKKQVHPTNHPDYSKAVERFCFGECAILAYALCMRLGKEWTIALFTEEGCHALALSPCGRFTVDAHGVNQYEVAREGHYGFEDYDADDEEADPHTQEGFNDFIDLTDHYNTPPTSKEKLDYYLEDKFLQEWVEVLVAQVKKELA